MVAIKQVKISEEESSANREVSFRAQKQKEKKLKKEQPKKPKTHLAQFELKSLTNLTDCRLSSGELKASIVQATFDVLAKKRALLAATKSDSPSRARGLSDDVVKCAGCQFTT